VEFSIEHHLIREQTLRETANTFSDLLNKLPKRQKEIIYLRFYQDLEVSEIVEIMEINAQSVYNLIHKALANLRAPLEAKLPGHSGL
jgi:RNA polymerase sigma factor (sigma-70 family)